MAQLNQDNRQVGARSDSYVRDHLANERTFLAWLRTALALMGFGVLIARLRWLVPAAPVHHGAFSAIALGLMLACIGLAMIPYALLHYFSTRRAIDNNSYEAIGASIVLFAVIIGIAGIGIIVYLSNSSSLAVTPASRLP